MKLTIKNDYGKFGKKWVKDADTLTISVVHSFSPVLDLYAVVNGQTYKIVNNKFTLTKLVRIKYNINIRVLLNGKVLKTVPCEPLEIITLDSKSVVIPEIEHITNQLNNLKDKFTEEINELKEENARIKEENDKLKAYIQNDVGDNEDE